MKMYICVLDEVPSFIVPCLVGHSVLRHHVDWYGQCDTYDKWIKESFRKCVVSVSEQEFQKISCLPLHTTQSWENNTLGGKPSCITVVVDDVVPKVLAYAKLWKP